MLSFMAYGHTHPSSIVGMENSAKVPRRDANSRPARGVKLHAASRIGLLATGTSRVSTPAAITSPPSTLAEV
jgi:hypothetical protein